MHQRDGLQLNSHAHFSITIGATACIYPFIRGLRQCFSDVKSLLHMQSPYFEGEEESTIHGLEFDEDTIMRKGENMIKKDRICFIFLS